MPNCLGKNGEKKDYSEEIAEKQKIIFSHLQAIGWTMGQFSGDYCNERQDFNWDDLDYKRCRERIKKNLTSPCKTQKILVALDNYINHIESLNEFKKTKIISINSITKGMLDYTCERNLENLSILMNKYIKK